jgi:hypothetical protein
MRDRANTEMGPKVRPNLSFAREVKENPDEENEKPY